MLVFDPATMNVTRFTLARGLVNGGYYEMARAEILSRIGRDFGQLSAEQTEQIRKLPVPQLESLAEALLDFDRLADLEVWLAEV
ncbi:MAG: hypothetical protein RLZZ184_3972 [Cyanobacteriota bacterium]|jgi:hypothetical protein